MRTESMNNAQAEENVQVNTTTVEGQSYATAFEYLKSLPRNLDKPALESYKRDRTSAIIDCQVAEDFTTSFRSANDSFHIPVSWCLTKDALLKLLGITSYEGYPEVDGVRFYGGLNGDNYLTLIAVSTTPGEGGRSNDLTIADNYPYYDYSDLCPSHCSNTGNLSIAIGPITALKVAIS